MSAILLGIFAKTNMTTFYGPAVVPTFGEHSPYNELAFEYFKKICIDENNFPITLENPKIWTDEMVYFGEHEKEKAPRENKLTTVNKGIAKGRLIGGNLNTMEGIFGSCYMPEILDGDILFIEDSLVNISVAERSFSLLKLNGIFEKISGILIGKPELFDDKKTNRKYYETLLEVLGPDFKKPILADFDCGHTKPMLTIPIGAEIEMDATNQKVSIVSAY